MRQYLYLYKYDQEMPQSHTADQAIVPQGQDSRAFSSNFRKRPWPKLGKNDDLTSKLGKINDIEQNKGSKIYPQNQVILDRIMPSIPLKHKFLSIILIWVNVSHK